jgi:hypothetical protein
MARKKSNLKLAEPKSDWSANDADIEKYARALVAKALSPSALVEYVTDYIQPILMRDDPEEAIALRTTINSRYPELRRRQDAGDHSHDLEVDLSWIEERLLYHVGMEVGRRITRD